MAVTLSDNFLDLKNIIRVSKCNEQVKLSQDSAVKSQIDQAYLIVKQAIDEQRSIYGITTNFGGLSDQNVSVQDAEFLQENLIWGLFCGIGKPIPNACVRAGMLLRVNSLLKGASGIRFEILERYCQLLNVGFTPVVYEHGSIGASGDLVPLAHIAGAAMGYSNDFEVTYQNKRMGSIDALKKIGLQPIKLKPKEGLALVNGTSVLTGIAALCLHDFHELFYYALYLHAMMIHAMESDIEAFSEFPHRVKPHPGQIAVAAFMQELLKDSSFVYKKHVQHIQNNGQSKQGRLIQDRYSIRCLPQFLGPILEGIGTIKKQIEIEANSVSDNPLIDIKTGEFYHAGNFLGEHIALCMDQLRIYIALVAKHLDAQISMLVVPEFSSGLPSSLAAPQAKIKYGLNGLQICANSIVPRLIHLSHNITTLFPTHAETFNQNINSQGYASANLSREAVEILQDYLAVASIFAVQAIEIKTFLKHKHYNASAFLPKHLKSVYEMIYQALNQKPNMTKPLIENNTEQSTSQYIRLLANELRQSNSDLIMALQKIFLA